jgi:uncharacterized protein with beta-barrel porin domain
MATLFVDKIDPQSGTSLEIGSSGDTITTATGAKPSFLYPAFEAILSSSASINHDTQTKVQCNTEVFDTNSCYDNSSNYRFTPTVAGKYLVYSKVRIDTTAANCEIIVSYIFKNGSSYTYSVIDFDSNDGEGGSTTNSSIIDMNGSSDYVEFYAYGKAASGSGTLGVEGASSNYPTLFGAYRIGT